MSSIASGSRQDDAVVGPQHLHRQVGAREAFLERERPRRVHARAERREDADAPVADLVGEALDHDRAVVGDRAGRLALLVEVARAGSSAASRVEPVGVQPRFGRRPARARAARAPCAPSARPSSSGRPGPVAPPERRLAGLAGRGRDDDAVERDLLDPPRRSRRARTSRRRGSRRPSPRRARRRGRRRGGTRRTARGRGSCRRSRSRRAARLRARAPGPARGPTRRAAAARRTDRTGTGRRACRAPRGTRRRRARRSSRTRRTQREQRVDVPLVDRDRGDDLLREHVERVARVAHLLDEPVAHRGARPRSLRAGRRGTSGRSCPCSARRPGGRRARRAACRATTEPGDSTSTTRSTRAHVDAELEAARRDDRAAAVPPSRSDSTCSRCSRESEPWCARTSSSPASSLRCAASRSAMRRALQNMIVVWCARISSSSRGCTCGQMLACRLRRVEVDRPVGRRPASYAAPGSRELGHVVDRDDDLEVELLARAGVDDRDRPRPVVGRGRRGTARSRRADAASPRGRCAAAAGSAIASSRSRDSIRCAPRLVGASAWISSMITYSTRAQRSRAPAT